MIRHRPRRSKLLAETNLDALVPADSFYGQLESRLDLPFVRLLARGCCYEMGRPSIDPVVFFKFQLIAFRENHL